MVTADAELLDGSSHGLVRSAPWPEQRPGRGSDVDAAEQGQGQGPQPADGRSRSLYDHAGGQVALRHFVDVFYRSVLRDPVLQPVFGDGRPEHVDHLAAFDAECFGGPDEFTRVMGGFDHLIAVHRGLRISEPQRQRFVELYLAAADAAGLPDDVPFRRALRSHVEFGTQVAVQNSHADTDDQLHPLRHVPLWSWPTT